MATLTAPDIVCTIANNRSRSSSGTPPSADIHPGWALSRPLGARFALLPNANRDRAADSAARNLQDRALTLEQLKDQAVDCIIGAAGAASRSALYHHAFSRWLSVTQDEARFVHAAWATATRVLIGTSAANALETGAALHHTYGVPYLPGSALKGCARAYAVQQGVQPDYLRVLFGAGPDAADHAADSEGVAAPSLSEAGCVVFHDAWWIPLLSQSDSSCEVGPLEREVITPHHVNYYSGKGDATDFDSPVPVPSLGAVGSYYFVIEGDPAWARAALRLLQGALQHVGVGAKRAAGYGLFVTDAAAPPCQAAAHRLNTWLASAQQKQRRAAAEKLSPRERFDAQVRALSPEQLAKKLGIGRGKWAEQLGIGVETLRQWARECVPEDIRQQWRATAKGDKAARKALGFLNGESALNDADAL